MFNICILKNAKIALKLGELVFIKAITNNELRFIAVNEIELYL